MFTRVVRLVFVLAVLGSVATRAVGEEKAEPEPFKPDADYWLNAASDAMKADRYGEAYLAANQVLEVGGDKEALADAYVIRALVRVNRERPEDAIVDCTKALDLDPNCEVALSTRAASFVALKRVDLAIKDCDRLVKIDPKETTYYQLRSRCWCEKNEGEKAVADATKAIELAPEDHDGFALRAEAYAIRKQYRLAIADFKRTAELCRDSREFAAYVLALVACPSKAHNDYQGAIELARQRCKATEWKDCLLVSLLASIYAEAGDFQHAVEYGRMAVDLSSRESHEQAEHDLELFSAGKSLDWANKYVWPGSESVQR